MQEDDLAGAHPDHPGAARRPAFRPARHQAGPAERQAVLVDARFWAWLNDEESDRDRTAEAQQAFHDLVAAHGARLVRTLWYSDQDAEGQGPGVQHRRVPSNAQDQGVSMLRAMAHDLQAMALHRAVDRVLLVSDDDRLLLAVDGDQVPVRHFGVVLPMAEWQALAARLQAAGQRFIIEPHIRFKGEVGEQATMFFLDPSGNAIEFKAFKDIASLFAK